MTDAFIVRNKSSSRPRHFAWLGCLLTMLMSDCYGGAEQESGMHLSSVSDQPENDASASETLVIDLNVKIMTFNTGTTKSMLHGLDWDSFTEAHAVLNNECGYSDNLAWRPAEKALGLFVEKEIPDIVGFQELFDYKKCSYMSDDCLDRSNKYDFVCSDTDKVTPQAERILGDDYYYLYSKEYSDNAIGIKKSFAQILNPNVVDGKPYPNVA